MISLIVGMRWANGLIIAIRNTTVRSMIRVHRPWTLMITMLHTWWRLDVDGFQWGGRLRSWRRTVVGDTVWRHASCHG